MALKLVEKEIRVPGGAIPEAQRRQGALGKLDGMGFREFQKMPLIDRKQALESARQESLLIKKIKDSLGVKFNIDDIDYDPGGGHPMLYLNQLMMTLEIGKRTQLVECGLYTWRNSNGLTGYRLRKASLEGIAVEGDMAILKLGLEFDDPIGKQVEQVKISAIPFMPKELCSQRLSEPSISGAENVDYASCIFICRGNPFYQSMFGRAKEILGQDAAFITLPQETESLDGGQKAYLARVLEYAKLQGIPVVLDATMDSMLSYSLPEGWDTVLVNDSSAKRDKLVADPSGLANKTKRWVMGINEFLTVNCNAETGASAFKKSLAEAGLAMVEKCGADAVAIVIGTVKNNEIYNALNSHVAYVEIGGKEIKVEDTTYQVPDKEVRDGMYRFIESAFRQAGVNRVLPAFIIDGALVVLNDYDKISMGECRLYSTGGRVNETSSQRLAVFADRHVGVDSINNGACHDRLERKSNLRGIFLKHENNIIEKIGTTPYITGGDPRVETDDCRLAERLVAKIHDVAHL